MHLAFCTNSLSLSHQFASKRIARFNTASKVFQIRCSAPGGAHDALERAIQVVNRVITVGERAGWGSSDGGPGSAAGGQRRLLPERWVQFGSAAAAQVAVEEVNVRPGAEAGAAPAAARTLRAYLAVPPEQYSLLDPKWIQRQEDGRSFKLTIPLGDLLGLDLTPEIHIEAGTDRETGSVTLVGTRAALGHPDLDAAFRLQLVAVLSQQGGAGEPSGRGEPGGSASTSGGGEGGGGSGEGGPFSRLRLRRPRHLPGRPVYRLRKLVARARGRDFPPPNTEAWDTYAATHLPSFSSGDEIDFAAGPAAAKRAAGQVIEAPAGPAGSGPEAAGLPEGHAPVAAPGSWQPQWAGSEAGAELPDSSGASSWAEQDMWRAGWDVEVDATPVSNGAGSNGAAGSAQQWRRRQQEWLAGNSEPALEEASAWPAADWEGPRQQVGRLYLTSDESDDDCYAAHAVGVQQAQQDSLASVWPRPEAPGKERQEGEDGTAAAAAAGPAAAVQAQLGCRVSVRVALRVPAPARVVPNALLGYAGRLLLKAVLSAALPNFLDLLASDYKRWAGGGGAGGPHDVDSSLGSLFGGQLPGMAPQQAPRQ